MIYNKYQQKLYDFILLNIQTEYHTKLFFFYAIRITFFVLKRSSVSKGSKQRQKCEML